MTQARPRTNTYLAGLAALALGSAGVIAGATPASAQFGHGHRGFGGHGFHGGHGFGGHRGFYGGHGGFYGGHRFYGGGHGFYPGYYGHRHGYYGYGGGAVAAGLIGGLALGALAASPAYYGGYGYGYGYPGYYGAGYGYGGCYLVRRRVIDPYGTVYIRRIQVCE